MFTVNKVFQSWDERTLFIDGIKAALRLIHLQTGEEFALDSITLQLDNGTFDVTVSISKEN